MVRGERGCALIVFVRTVQQPLHEQTNDIEPD